MEHKNLKTMNPTFNLRFCTCRTTAPTLGLLLCPTALPLPRSTVISSICWSLAVITLDSNFHHPKKRPLCVESPDRKVTKL